MKEKAPDWTDLRQRLLDRCRGCCECCCEPLPARWECQHRRARGMNGTRRSDVHTLPNLMALCPPCHDDIERHNRARAFEKGWAVRQNADPAKVPAWIGERWCLLLADGSYGVEPDVLPW